MNQRMKRTKWGKCLALAGITILGALATGTIARAAAPPSGSTIGNQASASYTDASATPRTATSNPVVTTVLPVYALNLTTSQNVPAAPGAPIYFPHTLTNNGNATDTFNLTPTLSGTGTVITSWGTTNFDFTLADIKMYVDANGDGNPDNFTAVTNSGPIAAGSSYKFVLAVSVPGTRASGDIAAAIITATSTGGIGPHPSTSNQDSVKVSGNAVIAATKGISVSSGVPGTTPITYTITYTNNGNAPATAFTITDVIQPGLTYVPGSGRWSVSGASALTDDNIVVEPNLGIDYVYNSGTKTITAIIASVAPNASGTLTYSVGVNALPLAPQTIPNTATTSYNDGASVQAGATNNAPFTVLQVASIAANGSATSSVNGTGESVTVASALQGATVTFNDYIWNTGNGSDRFNLTYPLAVGGAAAAGINNFPSGTTFQLFKEDGVTPLSDTNSDSILDTGLIPRPVLGVCPSGFVTDAVNNACGYKVVVKATLPTGAHNGGVYDMPLTATSIFDNSKTDPVINELTTILNSAVDMTNNTATCGTASVCGAQNSIDKLYSGAVESSAVTIKTVNPGQTAAFTLFVSNVQGSADSFELKASTDSTFAAITLPAGWNATFKLPNDLTSCTESAGHLLGTTITNTGLINSGANIQVCAVITIPATQTAIPAPGQSVFFRVMSPTTGASDRKWDAIIINTLRSITLAPNQSGQVFPGGTVTYPHELCNTGNVTEPTINLATTDSLNIPTPTGWSSVVYDDINGNGVIDALEPVISSVSNLASTNCKKLVVKVFSPSGAALNDTDQTTITASTPVALINGQGAPANATALDLSQVIAGQVRLTKKQAYDATCSGSCGGTCSYVATNISAKPGECIRYEITAVNDGSANVTGLVINDTTPASTAYESTAGPAVACSLTTPAGVCNASSAPVSGSTGTVSATVNTLLPNQKAILNFGVKIDQ